MKKDFESRFMPNVKFLLPKSAEFGFWINFLAITKLHSIDNYIGFCTNAFGDSIYNGFEHIELFNNYKSVHKEVSIFEAIPELIPDGMRYNKELDKLVPDVIKDFKPKKQSVCDWAKENYKINVVAFDDVEINKDEYPSKIKVESEKIVDITLEDKEILTALRQYGKSYLEIINVIKNTDTFLNHNKKDDITPEYYGEKCLCGRKIDWYVIGDLYNKGKGSAWDHAGKKLLRAGEGHKDLATDIKEVINSLNRWLEQIKDKEEVNAK